MLNAAGDTLCVNTSTWASQIVLNAKQCESVRRYAKQICFFAYLGNQLRFGGEAGQFVRMKFETKNGIGFRPCGHSIDNHLQALTTFLPQSAIGPDI